MLSRKSLEYLLKTMVLFNFCLKVFLNTPDDSDFGYSIEADLQYTDNKKEKTKKFPFCPENKKIILDRYNYYMNKIKTKIYTKSKKLICDWTDKKEISDSL